MNKLVLILIVFTVLLSTLVFAAPAKTIAEWTFDSDTDGWTVNNHVEGLAAQGGALTGKVSAGDPSIAGPVVDIAASPYQYVEISISSDKAGNAQLYWANTTEGQYGGFSDKQVRNFAVAQGEAQVVRIYPFWQDMGKIVRLRIDPPDGATFAIDYVRVAELDAPSSSDVFFDFTKQGQVWFTPEDTEFAPSSEGVSIRRPGDFVLFSPRVDIAAASYPIVSIMAKSTGADVLTLRWITDARAGVESYRVPLNPDSKWHAYNIRVADIAAWAGRIKMLAVGGALSDGQQVDLRFAGASTKPMGSSEFEIRGFGFKDPVNRVVAGKPAILQAELVNIGGESVKDEITVRFKISAGNKLNINPVQLPSAVGLKPGGSLKFVFEVTPEHPGTSNVTITIDNATASASASASLVWYPTVGAQASSYVPEPVPVKGDYEVGMYYFPGWKEYRAWSVLDSFPDRRPLLGYYREGDPQVADWHIKWMTEHGITFVLYDWYWSAGGRSLEHALHEGYFNARYHDKIKFALLWANHNAAGTSSADDMVAVTNYWLDNYFTRPDYFKVDGKPVVVIFSTGRLTADLGVEGVKAAFDKSRDIAKTRGLPGIYFVGCTYPGNLANLELEGYDALTGYNYPSAGDKGQTVAPYADNVTGYQDFWNAIADSSNLRYIPVTDPGWDSRPWHGAGARVRTGKTPELFKTMLQNAKSFVDKETPAGTKIVLAEAWNEFGEGDYIEPTAGFGFAHLDAIREVFTTAPKEHDDIVPGDVGLPLIEVERPKGVTSWDFSTLTSPAWQAMMGLRDFNIADRALAMVSTTPDPALTVWTDDLDSAKFGAVEIRMRVDKGKGAQLFWSTPAWAFIEDASARFDLNADGQFHTYRLDLSKSPSWRSKITALRFDPTDASDATIAISSIRFLKR